MSIATRFQLLKSRRTKIISTLGPASSHPDTIKSLIRSGVNVFRLNFSHGSHADHAAMYNRIQEAGTAVNMPIMVLADLCGPKIRVGKFEGGSIEVKSGSTLTVTTRDVMGIPGLIPSQYHDLDQDVVPGDRILLDDGNLEFRVLSKKGSEISCKVIYGGILKDHKGMNLPGVSVSAPALTEKDETDARFAIDLGVRIFALSFVRQAEDVSRLRAIAEEKNVTIAIISKIEKPEALENITEILKESDGIMVARGDLGVELPPELVPVAQEQLILQARHHRKPVIVATQMLESMITNPRPTRAEASDVSNAVRAGADAVMLSGETAVGAFPIETVKMMDMICRQTEGHQWREGAFGGFKEGGKSELPIPKEDAISEAAAQLSRDLLVRSIVVFSQTGRSIAVMSSARPAAPIIGISTGSCEGGPLSHLLWGVIPIIEADAIGNRMEIASRITLELQLAEPGHTILSVKGFSSDPELNRPSITVLQV